MGITYDSDAQWKPTVRISSFVASIGESLAKEAQEEIANAQALNGEFSIVSDVNIPLLTEKIPRSMVETYRLDHDEAPSFPANG